MLVPGCSLLGISNSEEDNPIFGRSSNERIVLALEKVYYDHSFTIIKPYKTYDDGRYALCADENGVQFKAFKIYINNNYHFACFDDYYAALLRQTGFLERAKEIAAQNGFHDVTCDDETQAFSINVTITDWESVQFERIIDTLVKIVETTDVIPQRAPIKSGFKSKEVKYLTLPAMTGVNVHFFNDKGKSVSTPIFVYYDEKGKTTEQLMDDHIKKDIEDVHESWLWSLREKKSQSPFYEKVNGDSY